MIRASCMTQNFGPNAPYYRRPKRIITQHFLLQNNGDFISKNNYYLINIYFVILIICINQIIYIIINANK